MASMNTLITYGGIAILLAAGYYAYTKGYLDDITGLLGGLGGEAAPEGEGGGETDPCIAECAAKAKQAYYYGYATKKEDEKKEEEEPKTTAAKCDCSKYETPAATTNPDVNVKVPEVKTPDVSKIQDEVDAIVDKATGKSKSKSSSSSSDDCKKKFGGKCTQECKSKSSSKCKDCEKACGSTSSLALAYVGTFYDGEVMDTAYYVTEPSSFIPRTSSNYGIAIA